MIPIFISWVLIIGLAAYIKCKQDKQQYIFYRKGGNDEV